MPLRILRTLYDSANTRAEVRLPSTFARVLDSSLTLAKSSNAIDPALVVMTSVALSIRDRLTEPEGWICSSGFSEKEYCREREGKVKVWCESE